MADDNADPVPQSAIPPKAVPPQARPVAEAAGGGDTPTVRRQAVPLASAPIPRTVRLKPIGAPVAPGVHVASAAGGGLPAIAPVAPANTEAAADAIKRMTARIKMMANEGDPQVGKRQTGQLAAEGIAGVKKATSSLAVTAVLANADGSAESPTVKKVTSRIQMSTTAPIPDITDTPKTIKIRPSPGVQPVSSTQPISLADAPSQAQQQAAGKAKTSRIPLESAMSVPQ